MGPSCERWYPVVSGVAVACVYAVAAQFYGLGFTGDPKELLAAVVNLAAITIGFIATSKTILISLGENKVVIQLKRSRDGYQRLLNFMMGAIHASFVAAAASAIALLWDFTKIEVPWKNLTAAGWLGLVTWAVLAYYRVISLFTLLLRESAKATAEEAKTRAAA